MICRKLGIYRSYVWHECQWLWFHFKVESVKDLIEFVGNHLFRGKIETQPSCEYPSYWVIWSVCHNLIHSSMFGYDMRWLLDCNNSEIEPLPNISEQKYEESTKIDSSLFLKLKFFTFVHCKEKFNSIQKKIKNQIISILKSWILLSCSRLEVHHELYHHFLKFLQF